MDFSAWTMCSPVCMPEIGLRMFSADEWPVWKELAGSEGSSGVSLEGVARMQLHGRVHRRGRVCRRGRLGLYKTGC